MVSFQIIPPAIDNKDELPLSLVDFYKVLGGIFYPKAKYKKTVVLEAIFSAKQGTSFIISVPDPVADLIHSQLSNLSNKIFIKRVDTASLIKNNLRNNITVRTWRPSSKLNHLNYKKSLVDTLAANLHGLKGNEVIGWQVYVSPKSNLSIKSVTKSIAKSIYQSAKMAINLLIELTESDPHLAKQRALNRKMAYSSQSGHIVREPEFAVRLRSIVIAGSKQRFNKLNMAVEVAAKTHGLIYNRFVNSLFLADEYINRTSSGPSFYIESKLLKQLFNIPQSNGRWKEHGKLNYSKQLPLGYLDQNKPDVIYGLNEDKAIGLSQKQRQLHSLIIGGTGMGKSTLLGYSFIQDVVNGNGVALIDPHGDLAEQMLRYIPPNRVKDVIYINPSKLSNPIAINLLELPSTLTSKDDLDLAKDFIAESIISIFRKVFSFDDSGGHRIEYILRNAIYTAFSVPNATIFTLHKLLTNDIYRAGVVARLDDEPLRNFWYGEFSKAGSYQKVKMISGVTAKLGRFERSQAISGMFNKAKSTINFDSLINDKKIIVCNFAKGSLGEDSSSLLGMVVLSKLQLAALSRTRQPSSKRIPFYLYVDEFELFNSPIFAQLISEARKFRLFLTLAEQTTAYQEERDCNILLANVGNLITFRTAASIDIKRLAPLFSPYVADTDLANLEPYTFYLKVSGEAASRPLSAKTIKLVGSGSLKVANKVRSESSHNYSYSFNMINKEIHHKIPLTKS